MPLELGQLATPAISVVIPTHNDAKRIVDALNSIATQTLPPTEIIVSDDASTDDTRAVVQVFAASCAVPVRYICHESHTRVVTTRNEGIAASTGDWIANCDSDDYWEPTKLERQAAFIRDWRGSPIALLGTHGFNVNDRKRVLSLAAIGPTSEADYQQLRDAVHIFFVIHSSVLFTRVDYAAVGGYTDEYGAADDFHFFSKIGRRGVVVVVPEPLTCYRKRAGSIQLASFWDQRYQLDRLAVNEQRRATGDPPLDQEAFFRFRASRPLKERFTYWLYGCSKYHYRRGTVEFANGQRVRGAARVALAALLARDVAHVRRAVNALRYRLRR